MSYKCAEPLQSLDPRRTVYQRARTVVATGMPSVCNEREEAHQGMRRAQRDHHPAFTRKL
jgi:hypothetical protein